MKSLYFSRLSCKIIVLKIKTTLLTGAHTNKRKICKQTKSLSGTLFVETIKGNKYNIMALHVADVRKAILK